MLLIPSLYIPTASYQQSFMIILLLLSCVEVTVFVWWLEQKTQIGMQKFKTVLSEKEPRVKAEEMFNHSIPKNCIQ